MAHVFKLWLPTPPPHYFSHTPPTTDKRYMAYYNNNTYQQYTSPASSPTFSQASTPSSVSSVMSGYSFANPRFRYYLSKSFDIEDDMEFCPDIPEMAPKKFNPYTAATFSPSSESVSPPRYQGRGRATANSTPAS